MSYFTKNPKKYMNVDKLVQIGGIEEKDMETYNEQIKAIAGINVDTNSPINMNNLTVKKFY